MVIATKKIKTDSNTLRETIHVYGKILKNNSDCEDFPINSRSKRNSKPINFFKDKTFDIESIMSKRH